MPDKEDYYIWKQIWRETAPPILTGFGVIFITCGSFRLYQQNNKCLETTLQGTPVGIEYRNTKDNGLIQGLIKTKNGNYFVVSYNAPDRYRKEVETTIQKPKDAIPLTFKGCYEGNRFKFDSVYSGRKKDFKK